MVYNLDYFITSNQINFLAKYITRGVKFNPYGGDTIISYKDVIIEDKITERITSIIDDLICDITNLNKADSYSLFRIIITVTN